MIKYLLGIHKTKINKNKYIFVFRRQKPTKKAKFYKYLMRICFPYYKLIINRTDKSPINSDCFYLIKTIEYEYEDMSIEQFIKLYKEMPKHAEEQFFLSHMYNLTIRDYSKMILNKFFIDNEYIPTRSEFINYIINEFEQKFGIFKRLNESDFIEEYKYMITLKRNKKIDLILE